MLTHKSSGGSGFYISFIAEKTSLNLKDAKYCRQKSKQNSNNIEVPRFLCLVFGPGENLIEVAYGCAGHGWVDVSSLIRGI